MNESDKANPSPVDKIVDELIEGVSLRERNVFAQYCGRFFIDSLVMPLNVKEDAYIIGILNHLGS